MEFTSTRWLEGHSESEMLICPDRREGQVGALLGLILIDLQGPGSKSQFAMVEHVVLSRDEATHLVFKARGR